MRGGLGWRGLCGGCLESSETRRVNAFGLERIKIDAEILDFQIFFSLFSPRYSK